VSEFLELLRQYDVLGAFWVNLQLTFWGGLLALAIGTVLAVMRISPLASLRWAGSTYVNLIRNTPLTVIMIFLILAVWSQLHVSLSTDFTRNFFNFAVAGLGIYHAAFVCESIRSGVNTVPVGQAEAARAIGLPFLAAARIIVLPQAFRGAIAPLGNTLIALLKNSTVAAAASVAEASGSMKTLIEFHPDYRWQVFATFAIGFVILVIPIGLASTWLSRRLAVVR
jgi:glutamate transport system permease protein